MSEQLALLPSTPPRVGPLRPIHYLGNKSRVVDVIGSMLEELSPSGRVCDLFSGSGVVAAFLAQKRPVIAADIQEYARVLASALLSPKSLRKFREEFLETARAHELSLTSGFLAPLIEYEQEAVREATSGRTERLIRVLEFGSLAAFGQSQEGIPSDIHRVLTSVIKHEATGPDSVLSRYYGGVYFSYEQSAALDGIAAAARQLPVSLQDSGLARVLSAASDVVSSVGNHFAQPVRPRSRDGKVKEGVVLKVAERRTRRVFDILEEWFDRYENLAQSPHEHIAVQGDYRDVLSRLPNDVSAIYADPPYTRDHYSRFYHVLETIALGDEPNIARVPGSNGLVSRGLYRLERHQSPFCIKSEAPAAFRSLIRGAARLEVPLVISYSPYVIGSSARPRLMTIREIEQLLAESFTHVEAKSVGHLAHSKLNAQHLNSEVKYDAEVLLIGRP